MAIALDATASGGLANPVSSLSWNHTLGANCVLYVGLFETPNASETVTSVVWDSAGVNQSLTKIGAIQTPNDRWSSLWVLANPSATGTKQITITASASGAMRGDSVSYSGASTTQPDSSATNTLDPGSTFSLTTTVVASGCWLVAVAKENVVVTGSISTGGTIRQEGSGLHLWDTNGTVSTGSVATTYSAGGSARWGGVVASIAPAGATTKARIFFARPARVVRRSF